jgi:hypothetical protein
LGLARARRNGGECASCLVPGQRAIVQEGPARNHMLFPVCEGLDRRWESGAAGPAAWLQVMVAWRRREGPRPTRRARVESGGAVHHGTKINAAFLRTRELVHRVIAILSAEDCRRHHSFIFQTLPR